MLKPETPLLQIEGLNQKFLAKLKKLEIQTVRDLLWHFPSRYEDFSETCNIADLSHGQQATVCGIVQKVTSRHSWRRRMTIVEAEIEDETGAIKAIWFNQPYIKHILRTGKYVNFAGKVSLSDDDELYLSNPSYEFVNRSRNRDTIPTHTARLVPIYPETKGLTSKGIRYLISSFLKETVFGEFIPEEILAAYRLPDIHLALYDIHYPKAIENALRARERFIFQNLFLLHLSNLEQKNLLRNEKAYAIKTDRVFLEHCLRGLSFELTQSQKRSVEEILQDVERPKPMNRLLQGDVGSGKTIVAALAALQAAKNGLQTAFMAPTEILARQHYDTLKKFFGKSEVSMGFITGSDSRIFFGEELETKVRKAALLKDVASNKVSIVIGTHALIQKNVSFGKLGLIVIDEQHRFGVEQRAALLKNQELRSKKHGHGSMIPDSGFLIPHFLSMSATPIPRTLMLTLFGDLDISLIDEAPRGRKQIISKVVLPENRKNAYGFVKGELTKGRQAFVICPRIEPTENMADISQLEVKTVTREYEKLSKKIFPEFRVAMLHGKMKAQEKQSLMQRFRNGEIHVLISTSVIEVGVDVPNATVMLIEGADRFGLAQLYQFRGRIGRGDHQSFCLLFSDSTSENTAQRLRALLAAKNGYELAEEDLKLRGPGEFIGKKQTGTPDAIMRSLENMHVIKDARDAALMIIEKDPELSRYPILREELALFQKKLHLE